MSAESTRAAGQAAADRELLLDLCKVTRPAPISDELDPVTGLPVVTEPTVVLTDEPCWVTTMERRISASAQDHVGGDYVGVQKPTVALSLTAPKLAVGDTIEVTSALVPINVGRRFTVLDQPGGTFTVLARYSVEEVI